MSRLQAAPVALGDKEYDPEIKDLADYIHKYKIDSDLAVLSPFFSPFLSRLPNIPLTRCF